MERLLSIGEVAKRLRVSIDVVRSLTENGTLKAVRTGGGHRRYRPEEVERYKTKGRAPTKGPAPERPTRRPPIRADLGEPDFEEQPPTLEDLDAEFERQQARERAEAERQRLEGLKKYGRDLPSCMFVPTEWRARVVEDLEEFVTARRLPPSLPQWEVQRIVEARVEAILKQCRDAEAKRQQQEDEKFRLDALIARGNDYAKWETIMGWGISESDRARREVATALRAQVKADWTQNDVKDLVDDVLANWEEDEGDDEEGDAEDDYEEHDDGEEDDERNR